MATNGSDDNKVIYTWPIGYKKGYQKAKRIYSGLGPLNCKALNNVEVAFPRHGFDHLIRRGKNPRSHREQMKRFVLLRYIPSILKEESLIVLYREHNHQFKTGLRPVKKWTLVTEIEGCKVKIVLWQTETSGLRFLSIMGDNVRIRTKKKGPQ